MDRFQVLLEHEEYQQSIFAETFFTVYIQLKNI